MTDIQANELLFPGLFRKLYEAEQSGLTLTAEETSQLLDYIEYMTWLTNQPAPRGALARIRAWWRR